MLGGGVDTDPFEDRPRNVLNIVVPDRRDGGLKRRTRRRRVKFSLVFVVVKGIAWVPWNDVLTRQAIYDVDRPQQREGRGNNGSAKVVWIPSKRREQTSARFLETCNRGVIYGRRSPVICAERRFRAGRNEQSDRHDADQ